MSSASAPAPAGRDAEIRERLSEALLDVVCEQGYRGATIAAVCHRAESDPGEFARAFGSKEEAFVEVYTEKVNLFLAAAASACALERGWRDGLRAGAYAAARWLRDHPREARFCILEVLGAGEAAQLQREETLRRLAAFVDEGRGLLDGTQYVSPAFAGAIVGAISEMLLRRLAEGEDLAELVDLVPELMYIAVRPYVDGDEALEELTHPANPEPSAVGRR